MPHGAQEIHWSGVDEDGRVLPAGIYFAQLRSGGAKQQLTLVLVR